MKFNIDKNSDVPVYRQIIEQIMHAVKNSELNPGDKLLPERELAEELQTARGTVKKAYEKLAANHVVQIIHGRGTFISSEQDVMILGRKEQAMNLLGKTLFSLEKLNFTHKEISTMLQLLIMERQRKLLSFHIATVDCNPEALSIFETQLQHISSIQIHNFLLDDILADNAARRKLSQYDIIITTATHYNELLGVIPDGRNKIIRAVVSPSQQTIIDLATLSPAAKIGIITKSKNFLAIIKNKLKDFQINPKEIAEMFEDDKNNPAEFMKDRDILITPPKCNLENEKNAMEAFRNFLDRGGRIIRFEYQLERSTLIRIEEKISELMDKKDNPENMVME